MSLFVGPSYNLNTRKADVQRVVNMMPTPVEAAGGKSNSYLAPVPGMSEFSPPSAGDPFWSDVLFYLPLNGTGTTFVDLGPLAAQNTISTVGGGAAEIFTQDGTDSLYGANTLRLFQPGAGAGNGVQLYLENDSRVISAGSDICLEWFFKQTVWAAAATPQHMWWTSGPTIPGADMLAGRSHPSTALHFRTTNNSPGEQLQSSNLASNTWRHVALQYVAADFKVYVYVSGTRIGSYTASLTYTTPGFGASIGDFVGSTASGPETYGYSLRVAHSRGTAANRYGNVPSIEVPTPPYPAFGS